MRWVHSCYVAWAVVVAVVRKRGVGVAFVVAVVVDVVFVVQHVAASVAVR